MTIGFRIFFSQAILVCFFRKSIKKLLIDKKIPAALRDGLPVLEWEGRVAAAWGVGADPAFRPRMGEDCYQILLQGGTRHDAPRRYDERH